MTKEEAMKVIIGVDPHKASHTAVALSQGEVELARVKVRSPRRQVQQLLEWAEPFGRRTWAIESAGLTAGGSGAATTSPRSRRCTTKAA